MSGLASTRNLQHIHLQIHAVGYTWQIVKFNSGSFTVMCFLPPSSFTFKMAFGKGTALMLKPEEKNENIVIMA